MRLPTYAGTIEDYQLAGAPLTPRALEVPLTRTAFAAAHVVSDPLAERDPWLGRPAIDWENTLKFRHYLWDQGLHLAEVMDTAQRGMGVDWETARELINRTMAAARAHPLKPRVACGAGTDQFEHDQLTSEEAIMPPIANRWKPSSPRAARALSWPAVPWSQAARDRSHICVCTAS
jgi:hypothetical protein